MSQIDQKSVRSKFNLSRPIWIEGDVWHQHAHQAYAKAVRRFCSRLPAHTTTLNLGSGGTHYDFGNAQVVDVDIAESRLQRTPLSVCASAVNLPFADLVFGAAICVGSVINYAGLHEVIGECARLVKPGGKILLDVESSKSAEYFGCPCFGQLICVADTTYGLEKETIIVYSPNYIFEAARQYGLIVNRVDRFHVISPIVYRLTRNERLSTIFAALDCVASRVPLVNALSSNMLIQFQKL